MTTKKKSTKAAGKKKITKKRDYGEAILDQNLPVGYEEAISTDFRKFDEFGITCEGKYLGLNDAEKVNSSKTMIIENLKGKKETWYVSQDIEKQLELNKVVVGDFIFLKFLDITGKRGYKKFQLGIKRGKK